MAKKSYSRREFLKSSAKVGGSAAAYGATGGGLGYLYRTAKDYLGSGVTYVGNRLNQLDEKIDNLPQYSPPKIAKKAEESRSGFWSGFFGRSPEDQRDWRERHNVPTAEDIARKESEKNKPYQKPPTSKKAGENVESRRGFFRTIFGIADQYPVISGAAIGATYGAGKQTYREVIHGKQRRQIAALKDDNVELRERVTNLEGKLEGIQTPNPPEGKINGFLALLGIIGLIIAIFFSMSKITGFMILENAKYSNVFIGLIFIFSLICFYLTINVRISST